MLKFLMQDVKTRLVGNFVYQIAKVQCFVPFVLVLYSHSTIQYQNSGP